MSGNNFVTQLRSGDHAHQFSPWQKKRRARAATVLQRSLQILLWNRRFAAWYTIVERLKSRVSLRSKKAKVRSQLMFLKDDTTDDTEKRKEYDQREAKLLHLLLEMDQEGHTRLEVRTHQ